MSSNFLTCKVFKDENRSYCLSAAVATLCAVLYMIDLLNSLVGGAKRKKKCDNAIPVLTGEGTGGQQRSMGKRLIPSNSGMFQ